MAGDAGANGSGDLVLLVPSHVAGDLPDGQKWLVNIA